MTTKLEIQSLEEYKGLKKAKLLVKDISFILNNINDSLVKLNTYRKYLSVKQILDIIEEQKVLLEIHLNKQKRIIKKYDK